MEKKSICNYRIVISSPTSVTNEIEKIKALFELGLNLFHLRKPYWSFRETMLFIEQIPPVYHNKIVIHDYYDLTKHYELYGIHSKLPVWNLGARSSVSTSTSTHSISEFNNIDALFDYAFLSPIFPSISKLGYKSTENWKEVLEKRTNRNTKLIALGGVHPDNITDLNNMGFDGYALLGAIWTLPDGIKNFERCMKTDLL